jgi:hypothetical protein
MVTGLPQEATTNDTPFVHEIFVEPYVYEDNNETFKPPPVVSLQPWLDELLTGPTNLYSKLYYKV